MVRSMPRSLAAAAVALLALACAPAAAQQTTYKCVTRSGVTYTEKPCVGGREVGPRSRRVTDKSVPPPQDRATLARRATLSADEKKECRTLDGLLRDQQAELKKKGDTATLQDEMPLVHNKKRYREIGC
ncbi:MAG: hypothetical protein K0R58_915 [Ramlibacter sp.]|jgi:hypothetical protein|nr:hypothetical protein [Ramlibacter sp.]